MKYVVARAQGLAASLSPHPIQARSRGIEPSTVSIRSIVPIVLSLLQRPPARGGLVRQTRPEPVMWCQDL